MGRSAKDLQRESLVHAARSFFQEMRVLIFRVRDAAEGRSETDSDPMLRRLLGVGKTRIIERHLRRRDGKLRVAIEPLQAMRRKIILGHPIRNFSAAMRVEFRRVETGDRSNAALLRAHSTPEIFAADSDAGNRTDAGNNRATLVILKVGSCLDLFRGMPSCSVASCRRYGG